MNVEVARSSSRSSAWEWWFGGGERFPTRYRFVEVMSCAAFFTLAGLISIDLWAGYAEAPWMALWLVPLLAAGMLSADFISGLVHWLADSYWHATTPFWGPKFVAPFREHHVDPLAITRHDFVEANCDNCLVALLVLGPSYFFLPTRDAMWATLFASYVLLFASSVLLTSLAHGWAHMDSPPALVAWLQRRGLLISREHHDHHHIRPHKTHYCITGGWLNPLLDRTRFFRRLEVVLDWLGAPRAEHD